MELGSEVQDQLDQLAKLPKAVRVGVIAGILLMLAFGYYTLSYQKSKRQLDQLRQTELELERRLTEVRSGAANIGAFEEEIAELEARLRLALRQLPNKKELEVLLTDISSLGKMSGIEITSFRRQREILHDFYAEVPIKIQLEGSFHEVVKFFDRLSKLPRIVNMGSLTIEVSRDSAAGTRLRVSGTATTFRFRGESI